MHLALAHHPHAAAYVLGAFFLAAGAEATILRARGGYPWRSVLSSLAVAAVQRVATVLATLALVPLFAFVWQHRAITLDAKVPALLALAFLAVEFAYYWMHRASHHIAWMWATHSVHHSAEELNFPAAIRLGATGFLSGEWVPFVPLVFFGIDPTVVFGLLAFDLLYQFFLHTELVPKLGAVEYLFNTPSHHRVHHARNPEYLDKNFGGVLIVYDRIFGTFAEERAEQRPEYGLLGERRGDNPFAILFAGWIALLRPAIRKPQRGEALGDGGDLRIDPPALA